MALTGHRSLVVQKYGGSSVADADGIKRVAQRIVATRKAGHQVVVVVSAMGDTTDDLHDLANQVSPLPPARELDMLLTAGERISMALLAMAIANLGLEARSFTGSQAGVITDAAHGKARIIDVTPGPDRQRARRRRDPDRGRLPGRVPEQQGRHHAGPGRLGHHRGGPGGRAERRRLRDLHRRGRGVHRRPPDRAGTPGASRGSATRRCWRWPRAAPRCCSCAAWSTPGGTACRSTSGRRSATAHRHLGHRAPSSKRRRAGMEQPIISGVAHDRSEAKITVVGRPRQGRARPRKIFRVVAGRRDQHRHDRAEHLRGHDRAAPTSRSPCRAPTARRR